MLPQILIFALGLAALIAGAELLVRGASRLAASFGVAPLVIGLTVVAFGTSAPEMAVSVSSALAGKADLALGNVIGSNIANVLLILGIAALLMPLQVNEQVIRQEVPIMIGASALLLVMALDGHIALTEAFLLFALVIVYTVFLIVQSRRATASATPAAAVSTTAAWRRHWSVQLLLIAAGLGLLVLGAEWLIDAATAIARAWGISDLVIGLTVVAVGTSMPEIATSIVATLRGERDIAIGNVVGSNVFNILAVLGASGLATGSGLPVSAAARNFDLWVMLAVAFACLPIMLTDRRIVRWEGIVFLAYYAAYAGWLVLQAQHHARLPAFSALMLGYVMPLTTITLVVSVIRSNGRQA